MSSYGFKSATLARKQSQEIRDGKQEYDEAECVRLAIEEAISAGENCAEFGLRDIPSWIESHLKHLGYNVFLRCKTISGERLIVMVVEW